MIVLALSLAAFALAVHSAPAMEKFDLASGALKFSHDGKMIDSDGILDQESFGHFLNFQAQFDVPCLKGWIDCLRKKHNFGINLKQLQAFQGKTTGFSVGFNKFMTWSDQQKRNSLMDIKLFPASNKSLDLAQAAAVRSDIGYLDWRDTGAVGPIKNQGGCGSCWAFAAVGSLEIQSNKINNWLNEARRVYSEQWLVDCSRSQACQGGWPNEAVQYIQDHGIPLDQDLPYHATEENCPYNAPVTWLAAGQKDLTGRPNDMADFVRNQGPVSACFFVCDDFYSYSSGIYTSYCDQNSPNFKGGHAITIIGFGTENGLDYWLARNQWGPDWGMQGYFKIQRGANTASIETYKVTAPYATKLN